MIRRRKNIVVKLSGCKMDKEKIEIIKIKNKKAWIDSFCENVEEIEESEDYLTKNYLLEKNTKKTRIGIMGAIDKKIRFISNRKKILKQLKKFAI